MVTVRQECPWCHDMMVIPDFPKTLSECPVCNGRLTIGVGHSCGLPETIYTKDDYQMPTHVPEIQTNVDWSDACKSVIEFAKREIAERD